MPIAIVLVPADDKRLVQTHLVSWNDADCDTFSDDIQNLLSQRDYLETPLLRPSDGAPGLYAYHNVPVNKQGQQNIRSTRLAMACGLLSIRFYGPVLLVRSYGGRWESLMEAEIFGASCISADLRLEIQQQVDTRTTDGISSNLVEAPEWLANAAQQNFHDGAALAKVISAMNPGDRIEDSEATSSDDNDGADDDASAENDSMLHPTPTTPLSSSTEFIAKGPLCLQCRRSATELCPTCQGAYFCSSSDRACRADGWSHLCLCPTWQLYAGPHRKELANFGDVFGEWQRSLTTRPHQLSEVPYEDFLRAIGIDAGVCTSWWRTELGGWSGGQSSSASQVDASIRQSYAQGFAPVTEIPLEGCVSDDDVCRARLKRNSLGLLTLESWKDYYTLRNVSATSPICLLCTFPLTIYYAIEQYGEVPVTVARMLQRPLRIHVVGAEKEMNFLDLFQELTFLLPSDLKLELVFVVREDMLPAKCQSSTRQGKFSIVASFENLLISAVTGTYGGYSLDPNFDCGTGPPDMVVALNAGLYAYESWRSVIDFLYHHPGIVGVFSDYNEYSGVNCAALGGARSRKSLRMNPFRQPRAMPVYSMNLPQYSNGFLYVFNEQELE